MERSDSDILCVLLCALNKKPYSKKPVKPYALKLAVRAITGKYLDFAKKLMQDSAYAESVARL